MNIFFLKVKDRDFTSLIPKISIFTLAISCLPLPVYLDYWPNIQGSYAVLFFTTSDFTSITSHIWNWVLLSLWLSLFNLSGAISSLFSSSILGTYEPGEFIFQFHIFLPFHTVHGVLKAWILKWFALPFSSGPCFVRTFSSWLICLGWPYRAWLIVSQS